MSRPWRGKYNNTAGQDGTEQCRQWIDSYDRLAGLE